MIIDNIFESSYAGNTERALARNMSRAINSQDTELNEFAAGGSGDSGNYFQALASAWYNGTYDTGSLEKGIKSQQDVERLLNRGIVCPDGKTRKLHIDYNSDFDGVEIYSDDYYEYGDHDDTIDSRTGQKWGPYDFMAFSDEDLSEGINEFAADDGDSGGEDDALHKYARMWWAGDEATQMQIEKVLARMGWEIGEDEGSYDNGGVFVIRAGDINGDSYTSWAAEDLTEGMAEDNMDGKVADIKGQIAELEAEQEENEFGSYAYDTVDGELQYLYAKLDKAEKGVAEGSENPFGSQGRFVGDTGPVQISATVPRVPLRIGDRVVYKPTEQHARIVGLSQDSTQARIEISTPMGGRVFNCKTSDLKQTGRSVAEVAPPGAKAERMVKHIKAGYAKDGKLTPKEKSIAYATAWKSHNKGMAEGFATMLANATSRDDLRQIRNFVTEHVTDKNKQRQIMEQATRIVAVQRRKYAAMSAK